MGDIFTCTYDEAAIICRKENEGRKKGNRLTVLPLSDDFVPVIQTGHAGSDSPELHPGDASSVESSFAAISLLQADTSAQHARARIPAKNQSEAGPEASDENTPGENSSGQISEDGQTSVDAAARDGDSLVSGSRWEAAVSKNEVAVA